MALQSQSRPEPMNATPHHSKVKLSVTLSDSFYIAGDAVTGKIELESRADKGLGLGIIMVELVAVEELTSRDHSATSTFLHTRRLFQGPGLPPSNAVLPHPVAGEPPLPAHHHRARRGLTTFLFQLPLPPSSPPSINFGHGLARIRYQVRASVGVSWKDHNRLVTDKCSVDVLQRYPAEDATWEDKWPAPEGLIVGEGGKIWVRGRVLGGILAAGRSACIELQVKNHSAKRTSGLHVTLSRLLHLPAPANNVGRKLSPPLQISDTLASVTFRGPEYVAYPGTEGIAHLVFDVPHHARTVSAYPRHGGDVDGEDDDELDRLRGETAPLFEVRGILAVRIAMPIGSKDIVLELPVPVFHPATLPPPSPEPFPYPSPDLVPFQNSSSPSPPPVPRPAPIPYYSDRAQSPLHTYPTPPPAIPLSAPINEQLVIPPYRANDAQPWFPSPPVPTRVAGPYGPYNQFPPPRPASANVAVTQPSILPAGLPVSVDYMYPHFPYQPQQYQQRYPPPPEETTGHGARAARISHHLRATSRGRSISPPAQIIFPAPVAIEVISPKPMPSPKIITETLSATDDDDPFAQGFCRVVTSTKSLSVVKLEEMATRAVAEAEATARAEKEMAVDKTLPVPPVPSGKPSIYRVNRRILAQDVFHQLVPQQERGGEAETEWEAEVIPRAPSLSALSLLRPPPRSTGLPDGEGESGLDALERRLVEQVGTRRRPTPPPPDVRTVLQLVSSPVLPLPPVPVPVPVPVKSMMAQEQENSVGTGAAVNESAISSLALAAEEDFGGRNAKTNPAYLDVEGEAEDEDPDADGRTQHQGKGAGASSGSERGTFKARSRRSAKSDSKDKDKDRAKGRVAEWLDKLDVYASGPQQEPDITMELYSPPPPEPKTVLPMEHAPIAAATVVVPTSPASYSVIESKPDPRSSGFVPVSTLRRAPIALPPESSSVSALAPAALLHAPPSSSTPMPAPVPIRQLPQKVDGLLPWLLFGLRLLGEVIPTPVRAPGTPTPRQTKVARPTKRNAQQTKAPAADKLSPTTGVARTPPIPVRTPRPRQSPPASKEKDPVPPRPPPGALFGLGAAATATPSSPALSSSIATPVLSSTASLARPPATAASAQPTRGRDTPSPSSSPLRAQSRSRPRSRSPPPPAADQRPPIVNGGGFKAEFAFGQARLRDLIKRYQGQGQAA
ncbi:hypothetical protein F5148DRAFT_1289563 [Russula earlei]|uniref:Uncharacterized protein n=1 Tax=Russula earlei TaxID=71964 RepID=A0ACC0TX74_9AGAM|nr:hypothetical protein F5148DRAFT_1289563 [Russula earlei]